MSIIHLDNIFRHYRSILNSRDKIIHFRKNNSHRQDLVTRSFALLPMCRLQLLAVILQAIPWCRAELFTAISDMESLLETHKRITDCLEIYIKMEDKKIRTLKNHLQLYTQEHDKALEDKPNYLGNPINTREILKRLNTDFDVIVDSVKIGTDYTRNISMNDDNYIYPTMEDVIGAAQALVRLQETYKLNVTDLSEGILDGVVCSAPMTTGDCYELGRALYNHKDVKNALAWMMEAHRKFHQEPYKKTLPFTEVDIVEHIEFSYNLLGDAKSGLEWAYKLLKLDPLHSGTVSNIAHFKELIKEKEVREEKRLQGMKDIGKKDFSSIDAKEETDLKKYAYQHDQNICWESLCRGEIEISPDVRKSLKCWYSSENHPFLKFAPLKVEQMYVTPDIFFFHDVLYDDEIEVIQAMAKPKFRRAVVLDARTGGSTAAGYRISKTSWLQEEEHPVIARITQRVADITGLDMGTAEDLQVANYGIGGHYEPHFDFAKKRDPTFGIENGNRIATVLFYLNMAFQMSTVVQGGATVFPDIGLSLLPIKGTAVFWMNLHRSGEGDMATRHGACPVLRGSKWVCTKWIHQVGQELLKPCTLEYQIEETYEEFS